MKRDFSQAFQTNRLEFCLLVQRTLDKKFLIYHDASGDEYPEDFHDVLRLQLDSETELTRHLARFLYENKLIMTGYEEIFRHTSVAFSFVDDTPGTELTTIYLRVFADVQDGQTLDNDLGKARFLELDALPKLVYDQGLLHAISRLQKNMA